MEATSYLLQCWQSDVEVAHSCLREALWSLALFQETETSTWLLTIVSDLLIDNATVHVHNTTASCWGF